MRSKKEILKELKSLRSDYHARLVLLEKEDKKQEIFGILALFDELADKIESVEDR